MTKTDTRNTRLWYCGRNRAGAVSADWVAEDNQPAAMLREAVSIANGRLRGGDKKTWTRLFIAFDAYGLARVISDNTSWRSLIRLIKDDPRDIKLVYVGSWQPVSKSGASNSDMTGQKFTTLVDALKDAWRGNPARGRRSVNAAFQEVLMAAREVWPDNAKHNAMANIRPT